MYGDLESVSTYLQHHEGWFCRCAQPMQAEPLGSHGYVLTVGRFGSMGYEVEPKMGVILEPPVDNRYLMYSVPVPEYIPPGYRLHYHAEMRLEETGDPADLAEVFKVFERYQRSDLPDRITKVSWELHLHVWVKFPRFLYRVPLSLLQSTGDKLLTQIIRQVSPRLTYKVQQDFHHQHNLPLPSKQGRVFQPLAFQEEPPFVWDGDS